MEENITNTFKKMFNKIWSVNEAFYNGNFKRAFELCNEDIAEYSDFYKMYLENEKQMIDILVIDKFDIH
ncbi:hypothetical protein FC777_02350 [Clostridium botulinum]|nr:hypothetical protein [Clostridium botulinum]